MNGIHFFKEGIRFRLNKPGEVKKWIEQVIRRHKCRLGEINFIFCDDEYLLKLNRKFLRHDFYTDIITFSNSESAKIISGDVFISYQRVEENSGKFQTTLKDELQRVMVHGVLHLLGYTDKTKKDQAKMRKAEDEWLKKRIF